MQKISIQKDGKQKVVAVTITEEELVDAFHTASKAFNDELMEKGMSPMSALTGLMRDIMICDKLTDSLFKEEA